MAAIDDLRAAVADLQSAAQAEHDELDAVVTALGDVEGQLTQLQTQVAQGSGVSEADLTAVTESITTIAGAARSAVESAKSSAGALGTGGPVGAPAPDPTGGTVPDAPAAPDPTAGGAAPDPTAGGGAAPEASVYVFDGDPSTVDTTVWPAADVETAEPSPRPLFHYSGDTAPGATNGDGVGGVWHVYTGATQPAGSGAAGGEA